MEKVGRWQAEHNWREQPHRKNGPFPQSSAGNVRLIAHYDKTRVTPTACLSQAIHDGSDIVLSNFMH